MRRLYFALLLTTVTAAEMRLLDAVQKRDQRTVLALLNSGADVNAARPDGTTPLLWAAGRDDAEILTALLRASHTLNASPGVAASPPIGDSFPRAR